MVLSLEEKIGQMLVVGFEGLEPPAYLLDWLAEGRIGGVILFARNVANPAQIAELTLACHETAARPIMIAIDQEGGVVARLRDHFTESPGAMALAAADSEELAEEVSAVLGAEMRALGINWNLAPALDLTHNIHKPSVGVRSLGVDPQRAARLGVAQVRGFEQAGVAATAKHFPGKANTPVDPHVSLPVIEGPLHDIWDVDLVPFRAVSDAGIAAIMITHVQFMALEPTYPSTMSPRIIDGLLRGEMGFEGVVSTDCMEMKAVTNAYGAGESAVLAALAGASTILFSHTRASQEAAYDALIDAARSGRLPGDKIDFAVGKVQAMKDRFGMAGSRPALDVIQHPDHLVITARAARAGMVLLHDQQGNLPLTGSAALVEFASPLDTPALESGGQTGFAARMHEALPGLQSVSLNPTQPSDEMLAQAHALAADSGVLIVATRNAHLNPVQQAIAQELLSSARRSILLALRNPYDAGVLDGAGTVLLTCGDSAPSLQAAVDALLGRYAPAGVLPVPLKM
ncbi:MAG: glycoside hydrolase family 3 protein [Chloroflexi bacterium]|nr:MAG: glycoside hydrolase family 3 protein [Chloroflexota bacterium]